MESVTEENAEKIVDLVRKLYDESLDEETCFDVFGMTHYIYGTNNFEETYRVLEETLKEEI